MWRNKDPSFITILTHLVTQQKEISRDLLTLFWDGRGERMKGDLKMLDIQIFEHALK